ncbi:hypothetical protein [Bacillus sp. FJAT-47783]|uniref:hypothetical protein n=1 Tax=Bacillus sp. FJAT-47783 TaxID=2922712 RepID=UPI001FAD157E|nr:hypothetical protein [Bacillus sp. FJAT-47783]
MDFFVDFLIVALFIIGITATMGVMANGIGTSIFGRQKNKFLDQSLKMQTGWKKIEGRK